MDRIIPQGWRSAEQCKRDAQGCLETDLQNNTYFLFATRKEFKYIQCRIKKKCMKIYYDNVLKEENHAMGFPCSKNRDGIKILWLAGQMSIC